MTNREWYPLISKEFNVSHSVAKGMLSTMLTAKRVLTVNRDERKKEKIRKEKKEKQLAEYERMDYEDSLMLSGKN